MKKLLMCLAIASLLIACSSYGEDYPPRERSQYEVDFTILDADLRAEILKQDPEKKRICLLEGDKLGNGGLFVYEFPTVRVDAYDACCPVHWGDGNQKVNLEFRPQYGSAYCPECEISFSLTNGNGSGSDRYGSVNVHLIKYQVKRPIIDGEFVTVFSNPKFEK